MLQEVVFFAALSGKTGTRSSLSVYWKLSQLPALKPWYCVLRLLVKVSGPKGVRTLVLASSAATLSLSVLPAF